MRKPVFSAVLAAGLLLSLVGCKPQQPPPKTDDQLTSEVRGKLSAEQALNGQEIQVSVQDGKATLTGTANDEASRALAANDVGSVDGVKTVINNLTVQAPQQAAAPAPVAAPLPSPETDASAKKAAAKQAAHQAKIQAAHEAKIKEEKNKATPPEERAEMAPRPVVSPVPAAAPAPAPVVNTPPPPPRPVAKTVTLAAGTVIPIRITEQLNSATTQPNTGFHGSLASDLIVDGMVAFPHGSTVSGRVIDAKDATHFTGSSLLSIELTSLTAHGQKVPVVSDAYSKEGKARGKNTAAKAGGGAAIGAVIGALAGGGKGAAIGAAAGGATGAGVNAVTRGEQVEIPSETLINFRLQSPVTVTTSQQVGGTKDYESEQGPQLLPR